MVDVATGQPIPDDPTDPVGGDLLPDMTDEQVESALRGETRDAPAPEDDEAPPEALAPEVVPDVAPAEEPAEEPAPLSAEERLAQLESQIRVERFEREKAEAVAERERFLHSRNAGELGYLKKMMAERPQVDADYVPAEATPRAPELDDIRSDITTLKAERVQQGIAEEVSNFQRAFPEAAKDEQMLMEIVQRKMPDYREFLNGNDPKLARTMARALLKESYAELRIEREQATRTTAATQSYDQADKLKARKIAAGPASTARTAPVRARAKTVDDLTDAELDAATDEYVRNSV